MKLQQIILENFRQFRGRQELTFSQSDDQNITLIHGENTVGKTALLNALLWGFYGHKGLSEDLPRQDHIINLTAAAAAKDPEATEAVVTILFEHESIRYTLRRSLNLAQQNLNSQKTDLHMKFVRDGQNFDERQPQARIFGFMPFGIHSFLFFNGERIDHLAMEQNASRITNAIHQMLGLKLLQSSIEDLKHNSVRGKLRAELRDKTSDEKKVLLDRQIKIDEGIELNKTRKQEAQDNLAAVLKDRASVEDALLANHAVHELQKRRIYLLDQQKNLALRRETVSKTLTQLISEKGFTLLSTNLLARGKDLVSKLQKEGAIPARVMNSFVEDLLRHSDCICHRPLPEGSVERKAVEQLLTLEGDPDFNKAVETLNNAISTLESTFSTIRDNMRDAQKERLRIHEDLTDIDQELASIGKKIKIDGANDDDASHHEAERDRLELKERVHRDEISQYEGRLLQLTEERLEKTLEIEKLDDKEAAAHLAQQRLDVVEHSASLLEHILKIETEELRPLLNDEIKAHFQKIIVQPYWPELSEEFVLSIQQKIVVGDLLETIIEPVGPSTGMRQVTSLVFIASLLALAKRRANIPTILRGLSGAEYPIVMDSPFGSLSTRFREGVTRWVPALAPQVVVMVSDTQFQGAVADTLRETKKVGKCYYLRLHGPNLKDKENDNLMFEGHNYQRYIEAPTEFSDIVEIER